MKVTITITWQRAAIAALVALTVTMSLAYLGACKEAARMERQASLYKRMYNNANTQLEGRAECTYAIEHQRY